MKTLGIGIDIINNKRIRTLINNKSLHKYIKYSDGFLHTFYKHGEHEGFVTFEVQN